MNKIHPNFDTKTPILVVGGAGYIGSHVCKELAQAGYYPITFDNLSTGHSYAVKWGPFIKGDLSDSKALDQVFMKFRPKAVLHFAGSSLVVESINDPGKYYLNNVACTVNLLEAMKRHNVQYLVFSSTCATYGNPQFTPITESHPQTPISPYGRSKKMLEDIARDYEQAYGLKTVALRYFNAAGADLETEIGENHSPESHLIPLVIETAMGLRQKIKIFGTDFETEDGTAIRDYIHVKDLAKAHHQALKWLLKNKSSNYLNLGTGQGVSVQQIVTAVEKHCNKTICVSKEKRRTGEPPILVANAAHACEVLDWKPEYSDVQTIISTAWKWHEYMYNNKQLLNMENQTIEHSFDSASSLS